MVLSQKQKDHRNAYYRARYTEFEAERKRIYREENKDRYLRLYCLRNWRKSGVKGNLEEIYDTIYLPETHCWVCNHDFSKYTKCLDHDHSSGEFRQILCHKCNTCDSWIKYYTG